MHGVSALSCTCRIGGIFRREIFFQILRFKKIIHKKTKNLYGSHFIFDQFAKF